MVFDPRNGLAPDTQYEIVTYGSLNEAATTEVPYVHIYSMSDTELSPYEAIEVGEVRLQRDAEVRLLITYFHYVMADHFSLWPSENVRSKQKVARTVDMRISDSALGRFGSKGEC